MPITFSSVDLPHPDGPMIATNSPWAMSRLIPSSAEVSTVDRKSTRLNSSHSQISYAVFCLKKKKKYKRRRECQKRRNNKRNRCSKYIYIKNCGSIDSFYAIIRLTHIVE